jgi:hypothetical protein
VRASSSLSRGTKVLNDGPAHETFVSLSFLKSQPRSTQPKGPTHPADPRSTRAARGTVTRNGKLLASSPSSGSYYLSHAGSAASNPRYIVPIRGLILIATPIANARPSPPRRPATTSTAHRVALAVSRRAALPHIPTPAAAVES